MPPKPLFKKRRRSESAKAKTQQRSKLKKTLLSKAAQYSIECESDVFVMIRVKRTGQRYIFDSSPSEKWLPCMAELSGYYPTPITATLEDVVSRHSDHPELGRQDDSTYVSSTDTGAVLTLLSHSGLAGHQTT
ncbi:hypothetical protein ASPFODRAFT_44524 [Aspergillus luchuensis CBS 106.47]|uniref:Uncharacterized protein n=1 Tax=Aspergillus luchuensis (strain CBS 106.47) TaxID=1137211 RepID=A0A1M3TPK1_ASPLC|nr:hypothetical protein ASPFODRAFT_44524 [Aspergillus luchuensis CBS 106.47]